LTHLGAEVVAQRRDELRLDRSLEKKQQPKEDWWEDGSTGAVGAWVTSIER